MYDGILRALLEVRSRFAQHENMLRRRGSKRKSSTFSYAGNDATADQNVLHLGGSARKPKDVDERRIVTAAC